MFRSSRATPAWVAAAILFASGYEMTPAQPAFHGFLALTPRPEYPEIEWHTWSRVLVARYPATAAE